MNTPQPFPLAMSITRDLLVAMSTTQRAASLAERLRDDGIYTFTTLRDGAILPLNRHYKPLCHHLRDWVIYEDYHHLALPPNLLDLSLAPIHYQERDGHCEHYLYSDASSPWQSKRLMIAYGAKLHRIIKWSSALAA